MATRFASSSLQYLYRLSHYSSMEWRFWCQCLGCQGGVAGCAHWLRWSLGCLHHLVAFEVSVEFSVNTSNSQCTSECGDLSCMLAQSGQCTENTVEKTSLLSPFFRKRAKRAHRAIIESSYLFTSIVLTCHCIYEAQCPVITIF